MISYAEVDKLLSIQAGESPVLSLYLWVPLDPDQSRGLQARAGELLALAAGDEGAPAGRLPDEDRRTVHALLEVHARDWLGHSAGIFVSGQAGLLEAIPLPCRVPERAVVAARPHVRPLLLALQRSPAYHVAVVDRRHAWLFAVTGDQISMLTRPVAAGVRSPGFGGWYGLDSYRIDERIIQLALHHFRDTAAALDRAMRAGEQGPLLIGGHEDTIAQFLAILPAGIRARFAGSFIADPHTLTPARVRELAAPVIADWVNQQEQRVTGQFRQQPPDGRSAFGLQPCLDAVNQHAVQLLVVPEGGLIPGFVCGRCGMLASTPGACPDGPAAARWVPDLIEEMVVAAVADGAEVKTVHDPPADTAARLRFPLAPVEQPSS